MLSEVSPKAVNSADIGVFCSRGENGIELKILRFLGFNRNNLQNDLEIENLRAEIFSIEQLKRHALTLSGLHRIDPLPGPDRLLPRLADNERILLSAYDAVSGQIQTPGERVMPAEAWLLDNFYLIEQQIGMARRHLPRGYSKQLPKLANGILAGFPRVYELALELVYHMDGRVDSDNATQFIATYQTAKTLKIAELWAFPIMLQLALLENLRHIGVRIACRRKERDAASTWADRMLSAAEREPKQLIRLLAEFANADMPLTAPFVEEFYSRLQTQGSQMAFIQTWVEQKLLEQGVTPTQLSAVDAQKAAANQISMANSIASLRFIASMDWRNYVESLSAIEQVLREDPQGTYACQDFATRDRYRHAIEDVAKNSAPGEQDVAREAIVLARSAEQKMGPNDRTAHVGYYLVDRGRDQLELSVGCRPSWRMRARRANRHHRLIVYLTPVLSFTALATFLMFFHVGDAGFPIWQGWFFGITGAIGFSSLAVSLVNQIVPLFLTPRSLPRLDFSKGIPSDYRTMVVVPTLLSTSREIDDLLEALEIRYLGNRDPNLFFALLTDFHDSPERTLPEDDALLSRAVEGIHALNERYLEDRACIFYLFHRPRVWNQSEQVWMGYERKRGKLENFNSFLRGEGNSAFSEVVGDQGILPSIRYVITLDTDTQLPRDTARPLIATIAHPLNQAVYDPLKGRIVEGYAILQPRASNSLTSAGRSLFTELFSGESGIDPYTREVSDIYQDIFGEGAFIGKGIYDVDAFRKAVDGRFPENLVLSHDLLESGYARSALVTDIEFIEDLPASFMTDASRRHRWIRGDWQIAGWLLPSVPGPPSVDESKSKRQTNPLNALSIWKIFDNLRRSLVPPSLLAFLSGGWLFGPGPSTFWTLLVVGVVFLPNSLVAAIELIRKPHERPWMLHLNLTGRSAGRLILLALITLFFLPYDALICLDAILYSTIRMLFSQRGLMLWHLQSYTSRNGRQSLPDFFREMWVGPSFALILAFLLRGKPEALFFCSPILILWMTSPALAWWISRPIPPPVTDLTLAEQVFIRAAARRTWRFFADFVSPEDNWLPPDNFQEYPSPVIASRTSPTNIGMSLLAHLAAHDFGYISAGEFLLRSNNILSSMEKLERYRGHFYNWYDTRTLKPLTPQYVSSVDSGNLAGCLLTFQAGLEELKDRPVLSSSAFQGLRDTLQVLSELVPPSFAPQLSKKIRAILTTLDASSLEEATKTLSGADLLLSEIHRFSGRLVQWLPADLGIDEEVYYWAQAFDQQSIALQEDIRGLVPDLKQFDRIPTLSEISREISGGLPMERLRIIDSLVERCRKMATMDFEFLYDASSNLLSIGYDVGERRRDPSCYDLLASESRLASFLLIAEGQVPQKHWFSLGRLLTSHGGQVCLISWSGSMFEYLMPVLLMASYENTLLDQTLKAAVSRQMEYGRQRAVPWGISESCYNIADIHHVYQYRAFGVPGLGFKRGLGDDLVIAPYASALALMVMPREACRNLQAMASNGLLASYGFYESVDYTPSRVPRGKNHSIVQTFMAHHQGMSLLAFAHILLDRPMQRRFMSLPMVRATELLLQERLPKKGEILHPHDAEVSAAAHPPDLEQGVIRRVFTNPNTIIPEVHLLSNGRYHVMVNNAGGGYSRWQGLAVTRWREDATSDCSGTFLYLRDLDTGRYWSTAYQPTRRKSDHYEAIFVQARAEYRRCDLEIETHTEITVSPEDDVEIRRVTLTNLSTSTRRIEITSYAEVVLAPLNGDLAHRSFSNLFVQTEILPDRLAILCTRRRRAPGELMPWMLHMLAAPGLPSGETSFETDRARFIGRGRTTANPAVLENSGGGTPLSNTFGSVLDPVVAIRRTIVLAPDESVSVHFISGVTDTREAALALLEKYCDRHFIERAFEMAWFQSHEVLRHLNATESDAQVFGRMATSLVYATSLRRAQASIISRNRLGQSGLWRFAVSGDLPITLVRIGHMDRIDLVKQILQAHAYWRMKGLLTDLVIINEDFSTYRATLQDLIVGLINAGPDAQVVDKPGGVFLRRAEDVPEEELILFQTVARVVLTDTTETWIEQVDRRVSAERVSDRFEPAKPSTDEPIHPLSLRERIFHNGLGGFTTDGREYVITLEPGQNTPAPWVNVIASPHIGTVVGESGSAYTWVENAHEFRLTPWHNDPISDPSGEALYIRDEETGEFWSPTPLPAKGKSGYVCRHGFGYSIFEHHEAGISSEFSTYVAIDAPVKFIVVKLSNHSKRSRRLSLTGYWELVLGDLRYANLMHIVTETDPVSGALFAHNAYGRECGNRVFFVHVSEPERTVTGNRTEFIGLNGSMANPSAMHRKRFSGKTGAGLDPCAAIQTKIELGSTQEREIVFVFGAAKNRDEARQFISRFGGPSTARQALSNVQEYWSHTLGAVHVETPDPALNVITNGWLVYQTLSSRLWARSGYYQSGGAYGFRDQLQDSMALIHATPWLAREQLLRCAGRQFPQGDVQHWWHPPHGQGVRTHFSDDYLWLPYAACRYVLTTGDTGVLDEPVHFLEGRELYPEEESYYDQPHPSNEVASLYEHCVRSIRHGLRFGQHKLPLMGCGDWNDGMNLVGHAGKGESVWLAWFLYENLQLFSQLAKARNDEEFSKVCLAQASLLKKNIEANAWDGSWYRRAYFDDGTPLGSSENDECQIDSISQSWAVISGAGDPVRARQAMDSVEKRLIRYDLKLIQLLSPPFDQSILEPGYIKGYVPGIRENGGQYTHAAIWTTMAFAMLGDREQAWSLLAMLNPVNHGSHPEEIDRYKVEPYVISADIYASAQHSGRGGWTWYTGAAGWMYRLILETLLGLQLEVDHLLISPCIPYTWTSYKIHYRYRETTYHITVKCVGEKPDQVVCVRVDGTLIDVACIDGKKGAHGVVPLSDDRQENHVEVELG